MRRDPDLLREILLEVERLGDGIRGVEFRNGFFASFSSNEIVYHVRLLDQQGLIGYWTEYDEEASVFALSNSGHDFLDAVRDESVWAKSKDTANKAGGWTLDLLKDLAKGLIKTQIKKHTGVEV